MEASRLQPMRLLRIPEPFDHPDRLYEVKFDRFRALAHVGHHCQLVSRNGHPFKSWRYLAEEIAHAVRAHKAALDGEIVCLDADGCSRFRDLLFRRDWPFFLAFDGSAPLAGVPVVRRNPGRPRAVEGRDARERFDLREN
jgi:bifunctional non-homologous end joining protein LigD